MNHNPFISRNNDLFIMVISGAITMFVNRYLLDLSVQAQFLMILTLGFLAGLFMNYLYQSLEWALFFALGIQFVALSPLAYQSWLTGAWDINLLIQQSTQAGHYSLFLLSSWIVAIPSGYLLQKLLMGDYYRKTLF